MRKRVHPMLSTRSVNKRGEGANLRREILNSASALLAKAAPDESVSLRAIARNAGISAPAIYAHFADRDAILDVLVAEYFEALGDVLADCLDSNLDNRQQFYALWYGYVAWAKGSPGRYRVLFSRNQSNLTSSATRIRPPESLRAWDILIATLTHCIEDGSSISTDPVSDMNALWAAIHGFIILVPHTPPHPWQPTEVMLNHYIHTLGRFVGQPLLYDGWIAE